MDFTIKLSVSMKICSIRNQFFIEQRMKMNILVKNSLICLIRISSGFIKKSPFQKG